MSYTARRQDTIEYNELSLRCLPGHMLGVQKKIDECTMILENMFCLEIIFITDRRPNPNAAQAGSLTSGSSFPSFRYRSGWNSWGSLKTLRSFNIDLFYIKNKNFRTGN